MIVLKFNISYIIDEFSPNDWFINDVEGFHNIQIPYDGVSK